MILTLKSDEYKSLKKFVSEALSDFAIITGKNGSGKTQLLELINPDRSQNAKHFINFSIFPPLNIIQIEGIAVTNSENVDKQLWEDTIINQIGEKLRSAQLDPILMYILEKSLSIPENFRENRESFLFDDPEYIKLLQWRFRMEYNHPVFPSYNPEIHKVIPGNERSYLEPIYQDLSDNQLIYESIQKAMVTHKKNIKSLTIIDIKNTPIDEKLFTSNDLFSSSINSIIYSFARKRKNNDYLFFQKQHYGKDVEAISDLEFIKQNKMPWDLINEILKEHNLLFYVKEIEPSQFDENEPYTLSFYKTDSNVSIRFEELSSGEKIIIGLILKLFTYKSYVENLKFPDLLLLDEPDAHLHPEMTKLLIDVLKDTFVDKLGIKVIMTTHSPTTVALAPENSIFELKNGENTSLKNVSKDYALNLLTGFIPTLSIDYKNHRQVFVESPIDLKYYQLLSDKHFDECKIKPKHKLYFISNALGKGNCDSVKDIVKAIRHSGNKTSFGIIDWDNKSEQFDNIVIHGYGKRYSIENFLFDPIYLFGILIDKKKYNVREHFNLPEYYDSSCLVRTSKDKLQEYSDYVVNELVLKNSLKATNLEKEYSGLVEVKYNKQDITINIPKWWLVCKGHKELIPVLKEQAIPNLFKCFPKNHEIEENLALIICKNYPLVPLETIQLIEQLGN